MNISISDIEVVYRYFSNHGHEFQCVLKILKKSGFIKIAQLSNSKPSFKGRFFYSSNSSVLKQIAKNFRNLNLKRKMQHFSDFRVHCVRIPKTIFGRCKAFFINAYLTLYNTNHNLFRIHHGTQHVTTFILDPF